MINSLNISEKFQNAIADNQILILVSFKAIAFIQERVKRGEYLEGSTGGPNYSTKPMPVPYGLFIKKMGKTILKKDKYKAVKFKKNGLEHTIYSSSDEFRIFRNKNGKPMVLISGGYKKWRQLNKKDASPVTMRWTARMMRNLGIIRTEPYKVETGFSNKEENMKAYYQHTGAGKNKIIRNFLGISSEEEKELLDTYRDLFFKSLNN